MRASYVPTAPQPNLQTATKCGRTPRNLRLITEVMRAANSLWPVRTAKELRARTGVSQRTVENWIALKTGISGDALARLQACEEGAAFIDAAILAAAHGRGLPAFYKRWKRRQETARMKRDIRQLQMRLEKHEAEEDVD
jgi:hypothetical protein